jgi:hypothetical protein
VQRSHERPLWLAREIIEPTAHGRPLTGLTAMSLNVDPLVPGTGSEVQRWPSQTAAVGRAFVPVMTKA